MDKFDTPEKIEEFLQAVREVESSGGTNLNHPRIVAGEQKGLKAVGQYGLTPVGFFDALRVLGKQKDNKEYQHMGSFVAPETALPKEQQQQALEEIIKSRPQMEEEVVRSLASRLLNRQKGDVLKAVAAYEGNPYQPLMSDENRDKNERVQKLRKRIITQQPIKKDLP
jgi:hypothetical protein